MLLDIEAQRNWRWLWLCLYTEHTHEVQSSCGMNDVANLYVIDDLPTMVKVGADNLVSAALVHTHGLISPVPLLTALLVNTRRASCPPVASSAYERCSEY